MFLLFVKLKVRKENSNWNTLNIQRRLMRAEVKSILDSQISMNLNRMWPSNYKLNHRKTSPKSFWKVNKEMLKIKNIYSVKSRHCVLKLWMRWVKLNQSGNVKGQKPVQFSQNFVSTKVIEWIYNFWTFQRRNPFQFKSRATDFQVQMVFSHSFLYKYTSTHISTIGHQTGWGDDVIHDDITCLFMLS